MVVVQNAKLQEMAKQLVITLQTTKDKYEMMIQRQ